MSPEQIEAYIRTGELPEETGAPLVACEDANDARPAILRLAHGLHPNVSERDYHQRVPGVASKHALDLLRRSPLHHRTWLDGVEEEDSETFAFGRASHAALLEPERFARDFAVLPPFGDMRSPKNRARRDEWLAARPGITCLDVATARAIARIVGAVEAHPVARQLLEGGEAELTLRWRDGATDLECKGRVDYYVEELAIAVDVKTTGDARADAFARSSATFGYHRQAAFYASAFAALGQPLEHFIFLVVERERPHAIALYELDEDALRRGLFTVREDLERLVECIGRDEWPGYPTGIQELSLPPWSR